MSPAQRHRIPPFFGLLLLLPCLGGCPEEASTAPSVLVPDITFNLTAPGNLQPLKAEFEITGTLSNISKLSAASITTTLRVKGIADVTLKGPAAVNFAFKVDPSALNDKGQPIAKEGKFCVALAAVGTAKADKNVEATGAMQVCVLVDRVGPTIEIDGPLENSTHIGFFDYTGRISDKNLLGAQVHIAGLSAASPGAKLVVGWCRKDVDGDCEKCLKNPKTPEVQQCLSGPGSFKVRVDRRGEPSATVKLLAKAQDTAGTIGEDRRDVNVLKAPSFDIARRDSAGVLKPGVEPGSLDEVIEHGEMRSFELGDFDGDGVVDAVMGTSLGVYLRRGKKGIQPGREAGRSTGPLGQFGGAEQIVGGDFHHLALVDLDQDEVLDVVAAGVLSSGKNGVAFMLARPGAAGAGGLKPVQGHEVAATIQAIAAADLNADGATDVVLGGLEDATALTVLYLHKEPICPSSADEKRACAKAKWKGLGAGTVVQTTVEQKLLGSVTSIAIADFIADDADPPLLDVAVGRDKAAISVCNNLGTKLGACLETNKSGFLFDLKDAKFIAAVHWNDDDKDGVIGEGSADFPDLIVATKAGKVRWVTGDHKGGFFFDSPLDLPYRTHDIAAEITSIKVAPVGVGDSLQVIVAYAGRTVMSLPVIPDEGTDVARCFRSFVLGNVIDNVRAADVDGDDLLDLVGMTDKEALAVAKGKGDGEFHAAIVHKVCGLTAEAGPNTTFYLSTLDVAEFGIHDLTGDQRQDLLLVSAGATSTVPKNTDQGGVQPQPALYFGLYTGTADGLTKAVRTGEFGPYNTSSGMDDAGVKDKDSGGLGKSIPPVAALAFAEINGSAGMDMILAFDTSYSVGSDAKKGIGSTTNGDILECAGHEILEMMNILGEESAEETSTKEGTDEGGTDEEQVDKPLTRQCKNFAATDKDKKLPLHGYGEGAYLDRASLLTWNGNPNNPFGIGPSTPPTAPAAILPLYAQSGGIGIVDIAAGDFDGDTNADLAVLARKSGDLTARVRLFKGLGAGRIGPMFYVENGKGKVWPGLASGAGCPAGDVRCFVTRYCALNDTTCALIDVVKDEVSLIPAEVAPGKASIWSPVTYRVVAPDPLSIAAAPFCEDATASLFTLSNTQDGIGSITWLRRQQGAGIFSRQKSISIGENLRAFKPVDVTQDGCTDLLCGLNAKMGFTTGGQSAFAGNEYFGVAKANRTAVDTMDLNEDGWVDLVAVNADTDSIEIWLGSLLTLESGETKFEFKEFPHPMYSVYQSDKMIQADLNADGCPDLAVKGKNGVAVYLNTGCAPKP